MSHLASSTLTESPVALMPRSNPRFSNFDFIEERFPEAGSAHSIHKLFSISRCHGSQTLLIEQVPAVRAVAEENEDLATLDPNFQHLELVRLSFWKPSFTGHLPASLRDRDCVGYALLKKDRLSRRNKTGWADEWHVYEAVFRTYPHRHTYAKACASMEFAAAGRRFAICGCLYAQQNGVSKTCAQVAIRSLATAYLKTNDISYRTINRLAAGKSRRFNPGKGMRPYQIGRVLKGMGINHRLVEYKDGSTQQQTPSDPEYGPLERYPCEKLLYAGVEGGCGALMSFKPTAPDAPQRELHMIPFFGHTFNEDSWVPNAEKAYFRIGNRISYVPSLAWLSHFLVHDDNFGANFCVPRKFISRTDVRYVCELLPLDWAYSGADAESIAAFLFCSIISKLPDSADIPWVRRLKRYYKDKARVILRHVPVTTEQYLANLKAGRDWDGRREASATIKVCAELLPAGCQLWMVEISVPEVFPTNKRKLGEILLDASRPINLEHDSNFVLGRLPGSFIFWDSLDNDNSDRFSFVPSRILSHTPLC
ncbi:MAG: hypothetical protein K9M97_01955 [Akkermansiaceae bacterium]|nr:hypothetical protein [Akkermansiaceae bacterium]